MKREIQFVYPIATVIGLTNEALELVKEKKARNKLKLVLECLESMETNDGEIVLEREISAPITESRYAEAQKRTRAVGKQFSGE